MDIDVLDKIQKKMRQAEGILRLVGERELPSDVKAALDAVADLHMEARAALAAPGAPSLARVS